MGFLQQKHNCLLLHPTKACHTSVQENCRHALIMLSITTKQKCSRLIIWQRWATWSCHKAGADELAWHTDAS